MLFLCRNNGPKSYIGNRQCGGESYVRTNEFGMFKLVNREKFSTQISILQNPGVNHEVGS